MQVEASEKAAQGFVKIYTWEELKKSPPPPVMKLSPLEMIPHKLRKYRAILVLSFELMLAGHILSPINNATKKMAPMEAIDQIGSVLPRLIEALVSEPVEGGDIQTRKLDTKDSFW